jgi:hypothetical protein
VLVAGVCHPGCFRFDPDGCFADTLAKGAASKAQLGAVACSGADGISADWDGGSFPGSHFLVSSSEIREKNSA